jgi:hypothetical protein
MNNRSKLVGVIVVLLLLLFGWRWWTGRQVKPVEAQEKVATASSPNTVVPSTSKPGASTAVPGRPSDAAVLARLEVIKKVIDATNSGSLDFYGKVIDQNGNAVAGAKIEGYVMTEVGLDGTKETPHMTESDGEGYFEFIGLRGERLGVVPEKDGYQFVQRGNGNWSPGAKTDPSNRVIFHMWKLQGAEPMVKARIHAYIPCDGTPTMFDLTTGKRVASGGNLTVRLNRDPVDIVRGKSFNWQLTVEVSEGGVQEIADLYPNEAPAEGYQQSVTVSMPVGAKNWSPDLQKAYYFTTGNGQDYGRIAIDLTGDFQPPPTSFDADIYVNTAGSRNLEFDQTKQVR